MAFNSTIEPRSARFELDSRPTTPTSSARSSTFSHSEPTGSDFSNFEDVQIDADDAVKSALRDSFSQRTQNRFARDKDGAKELESRSQEQRQLHRNKSFNLVHANHAEPNASIFASIPKVARRKSQNVLPKVRSFTNQDGNLRTRETSRSPSTHSTNFSRPSPGMVRSTSSGFKAPDAWIKNRKTAKEIEAEYRDSDDDLPDDASLYNVPMSPSLYRNASNPGIEVPRPPSRSPERPYYPHGQTIGNRMTPPTSKQIARITKEPRPSLGPRIKSLSIPTSPVSATMPRPAFRHGLTLSIIDSGRSQGESRLNCRSLSHALDELDAETTVLTMALDNHARESDGNVALAVKASSLSAVPCSNRQSYPQPSSVGNDIGSEASPPAGIEPKYLRIQRAHSVPITSSNHNSSGGMLESLPLSKEKEAVLSRTRPSWLPPKDRKEDLKHLKDHSRMMALAKHTESSRRRSLKNEALQKKRMRVDLIEHWRKKILPGLPQLVHDRRTRDCVWKGIPSECRPEAWLHAVGNDLNISQKTYEAALARLAKLSSGDTGHFQQNEIPQKTWRRAIKRDIDATMPLLGLFQEGQSLHLPLQRMLEAYAMYRSDAGYVHGMNMIGAIILLVFDSQFTICSANLFNGASDHKVRIEEGESLAFTLLANLMNRRLLGAFMLGDTQVMTKTFSMIDELFKAKSNHLWRHLFHRRNSDAGSDGSSAMFTIAELFEPMIRYLFTNTALMANPVVSNSSGTELSSKLSDVYLTRPCGLTLPLILRLWDVVLFDGDAAVIRVCVGLIGALEMKLYGDRQEVLGILGWSGNLGSLGWTRADREEVSIQEAASAMSEGKKANDAGLSAGMTGEWATDEKQVERVLTLLRNVGKAE